MRPVPLLPPHPVGFPDPANALSDPDGLLVAGGALSPEWLIEAYAQGIFPWFGADDEHILWWSPAHRAITVPGEMRVTRSLRKRMRNAGFTPSLDTAFGAVVDACSAPRDNDGGTWITPSMRTAYVAMHDAGLAHSVEIWREGELCGGLYGISLGRYFFGESMFSRESDASKTAFYVLHAQLKQWRFQCIDCQMRNPHLDRLGVTEISRGRFLSDLRRNPLEATRRGRWCLDDSLANLPDYAG